MADQHGRAVLPVDTRTAEATASGSVVSGFCTEVTFSPAA